MHLLFVCTGNTCRSPMAEHLARRDAEARGLDGVEFASAGVGAQEGQPASAGARHAIENCGLSLEAHRARRLTPELATEAGLILTMTAAQAEAVRRIAPQARVFSLGGYLNEPGDVADPWGGSDAVYEACARELQRLVSAVVQRLADAEGTGRKADGP